MACLVGVSRGKGQREIKARATRWTRKKIFSRAPIGVRGCYTFHGPLSLRGWTTGKVKGEDRKKSIHETIHVKKNSYSRNRQRNIHTSYEEEKTCTPGKPKYNIYNYSQG